MSETRPMGRAQEEILKHGPQQPGRRRRGDRDLGQRGPVDHSVAAGGELPFADKLPKPQDVVAGSLQLRRAAAGQPAEVHRGRREGDRAAAAGP